MPESICICGQHLECDRKCAGSLAQRAECEQVGHLTAVAIHERAWRQPAGMLVDPDFCYRCGHRPGRAA